MKKIIIPTDFSDNAGDALAYTLDFIGTKKAKIHIVNVVNANVISAEAPAAAAEMIRIQIESATENMKALEALSKSYGQDNIDVSTNVVVGSASTMIKKEAEDFEADLLIMGTRGESHGMLDKLLGTVSSNVIDEAPCPVILIPKKYKFKKIDNVIFSTNLNHDDAYELWRAIEAMKPHSFVVRCLHVVKNKDEKDEKHIREFANYLIDHSPSLQTIFNIEESPDVEKTIEEYADMYDAEMVIMHRTKRSAWEKLFGKSHTRRMTSWLKVPLMIVN